MEVTEQELASHCEGDDLWVAVDQKVYDVSEWVRVHPGGRALLANVGGQDVSALFHAFHLNIGSSKRAHKLLANLPCVGTMVAAEETAVEKAFRALRAQVVRDGLYETNLHYYYRLVVWLGIYLGVACYLVSCATLSSALLAGVAMALFFQQCAFVGHDAGHVSITHDALTDARIGILFGPLLTGISITWWKQTHYAHHVATNSITHDPDVQHLPVFAVTPNLFRAGTVFSVYHHRYLKFDKLAQLLVSCQHWLFFPIMAVARLNLYLQGLVLLLRHATCGSRWELAYVAVFGLWFGALTCCLPTWTLRFVFLGTSHVLAGILHVQISISHFSMPTHTGILRQVDTGFFRHQCATCLDLKSNWMNDWFYGGLQFQLAHHLFPRVPRYHLRQVQQLVQQVCKEHDIAYSMVGWWEAIWGVLQTLRATAAVAAHM
jgi:fatty acid desaturase